MRVLLITILFLLSACGGSDITTRQVYDRLAAAGLATNARVAQPIETDSPIGKCGERLEFDIPGAPAGAFGAIIVCPRAPILNVGAISGAVLYRSKGGRVSVLVSGAPDGTAAQIGEEVGRIQE